MDTPKTESQRKMWQPVRRLVMASENVADAVHDAIMGGQADGDLVRKRVVDGLKEVRAAADEIERLHR